MKTYVYLLKHANFLQIKSKLLKTEQSFQQLLHIKQKTY